MSIYTAWGNFAWKGSRDPWGFKMDLIALYGKLGLPYIEMTDEDCELELETVDYLKGMIA